MHNKYIIVGCCARCGSVYIRSVLLHFGLKVGHEKPDSDGVVGWQQLISTDALRRDAEEMAAGREIVYLMQVRHPVPAIRSMVALYKRGEWPTFVDKNPVDYMLRVEAAGTEGCLVNAIKLYYHLNNIGELETNWQKIYRIEAIDAEWPTITALIGLPGSELPPVPRNINTRKDRGKYQHLEWQNIRAAHPNYARAIDYMADRWGYDVTDWTKSEEGEE